MVENKGRGKERTSFPLSSFRFIRWFFSCWEIVPTALTQSAPLRQYPLAPLRQRAYLCAGLLIHVPPDYHTADASGVPVPHAWRSGDASRVPDGAPGRSAWPTEGRPRLLGLQGCSTISTEALQPEVIPLGPLLHLQDRRPRQGGFGTPESSTA